jgi:glucose dehydrogenase
MGIFLALILTFSSILPGHSFAKASFANWNSPAYDSGNTNFDPQTEINSGNIQNLQVQWIYQVPVNPFHIPGAPPALGIETTPLVVSGYVIFATPYNRLIALNGATGHEVWHYQVNMSSFSQDSWWSQAYTISSIAYDNSTIYMMASDSSLYAINAFTGSLLFKLPSTAAAIPGNTGTYYGEKAPLIYSGELIARVSTTDYGGRGYVAAYDLKTQHILWRWYSVPSAGGNSSWDTISCPPPCQGNVQPYAGDWGNTNLIGGGAAWGLMAVDNQTGILYLSTGHPSGLYDSSVRPGPNLYADSVVALDAKTGHMLWYYQITSHDVAEHEGGWSLTLARINVDGQSRKVVIQGAKNNFIYVLDARTGKPVYPPIKIGPPASNSPNDNLVNTANLTLSESVMVGSRICPGPDGGIEMSPALDGQNYFVVTQNACGIMYQGPITYKGQTINGYIFSGDPTASQNSTLYSINLDTHTVNWKFEMPDRYQGSSTVVSGGVVYLVDRQGTLYMLDESSGALLRSFELNGLGASGVSIGEDSGGKMMVFVPAGGGDIPSQTAGVVVGLSLVGNTNQGGLGLSTTEVIGIAAGAVVVAAGVLMLVRRSSKQQPK